MRPLASVARDVVTRDSELCGQIRELDPVIADLIDQLRNALAVPGVSATTQQVADHLARHARMCEESGTGEEWKYGDRLYAG